MLTWASGRVVTKITRHIVFTLFVKTIQVKKKKPYNPPANIVRSKYILTF